MKVLFKKVFVLKQEIFTLSKFFTDDIFSTCTCIPCNVLISDTNKLLAKVENVFNERFKNIKEKQAESVEVVKNI